MLTEIKDALRTVTMKNIYTALLILASLSINLSALDTSYAQLLAQITPQEAAAPVPAPTASDAKAVLGEVQPDGRYWVTAHAADKYARTALMSAGLDIVEIHGQSVSGFAEARTIKALTATKSPVITSAVNVEEIAAAMRGNKRDFPAADAAYHNFKETTDLLNSMASKNSDIASVFSIGKTTEGRDIWCLRINSAAKGNAASNKPGAFFLGNIHAREHLANEVPLLFASWLLDHRADAEVKKYIESLDIFILPMGNPDGVEYDIKDGKYQMFRKNMRTNADGSKGVDLNRNFDSWWCEQGSSHSAWSDTYCGTKAFSEPESQALKNFFNAHKNIKTHISYHTYSSTILYPYGGSDIDVEDARDKNAMVKISAQMAKLTGYQAQKSSDMYLATGDSCDWAYSNGKVLAFTFELDGSNFYPGAALITKVVEKNVKAAKYLLSVTANPYGAQ